MEPLGGAIQALHDRKIDHPRGTSDWGNVPVGSCWGVGLFLSAAPFPTNYHRWREGLIMTNFISMFGPQLINHEAEYDISQGRKAAALEAALCPWARDAPRPFTDHKTQGEVSLLNMRLGLCIPWCPTGSKWSLNSLGWGAEGLGAVIVDFVDMWSNFGKPREPFGCDLYLVQEKWHLGCLIYSLAKCWLNLK